MSNLPCRCGLRLTNDCDCKDTDMTDDTLNSEEVKRGLRPVRTWKDAYVVREAMSARLAEVEAERDRLREALEAIYEVSAEPAETDDKNVRGWIEVHARAALTDAQEGQDDAILALAKMLNGEVQVEDD